MTEETTKEDSIKDEFRNLSNNFVDMIRTAWDSPGRKNLQSEIEQGLSEFSSSLKREIEDISGSPTGQQIKSDYEDIKERVRTGEMETKVRDELVSALRIINKEIEKVSSKWAPPSPTADEDDSESKDTEVSS